MVYPYSRILVGNKILLGKKKNMLQQKDIMLNEQSQSEGLHYCMIPFI